MEQQGGRTRGDAQLDCGMQESIVVQSSASDVGAAPADQTKEEGLVEQQVGHTRGDAQLDCWMQESILVPSSPSDFSAASTDLFLGNVAREKQNMAKQVEDIKIKGPGVGHWWKKHQRQKFRGKPLRRTQPQGWPQVSTRYHQPPDDYG